MTNQGIVQKAASLFDDFSKWDSFLELTLLKDKMIDHWNQRLIDRLEQRLARDKQWHFRKWQSKSWGWYTGSDRDSLVVLYENNNFCLRIDGGKYDTARIFDTFKEQKIFSEMFLPTEIQRNNSYLATHYNAITIDGISHPDDLAWYAGHETPESKLLEDELFRFFSFFIHDVEIYRMITEINQMLK